MNKITLDESNVIIICATEYRVIYTRDIFREIIEIISCHIYNPVEHLRWIFFAKIVNGF